MNTDSELCTTRETVNFKRYFKTCMTVHEFIHMNLTLFPLEIIFTCATLSSDLKVTTLQIK